MQHFLNSTVFFNADTFVHVQNNLKQECENMTIVLFKL